MSGDAPVLATEGLTKAFGGLVAVNDFDMALDAGELVGLIGPNGAGKTTAFNLLTGVYSPTAGRVLLDGTDVTGRPPHKITAMGMARTFQNIRLFRKLTALDNVRIACHLRSRVTMIESVLRLGRHRAEEREQTETAMAMLERVGLEKRANEVAGSLPYGEQRRLEIARAMATRPRVLLLDEPAAGMNPRETEDLMDLIRGLRSDFDLTVLLIEHDMSLVMRICERILVLDYGEVLARGLPEEIQNNPAVIEAYLGSGAAEEVAG